MLNVRLHAQILVSAVLMASVACGNHNKKASLKKAGQNQSDAATERESKWLAGISHRGEKGKTCFQMDALAQKFTALGETPVTVQLVDIDFVKPVNSLQPGYKGQLFVPVEGDLAAQLAKNFLAGPRRETLIQTTSAKSLLESTSGRGRLLRVINHANCEDKVMFADAPIHFNVLYQDRRIIRLQAANLGGEVRVYELGGNGGLNVTIVQSLKDLVACGSGQQTAHYVSRTYMIKPTDSFRSARVTPKLAGILKTYVYSDLQIEKAAPKAQDKNDKKENRARAYRNELKAGHGGINVNSQLLDYMNRLVNDNKSSVQVDCSSP